MLTNKSVSVHPNIKYGDHKSWADAVKKRDNFTCQYSLNDTYRKHDGEIHAHHIFPKEYGGEFVISNGITLCEACHAQFLIEAEQKYYSRTLKRLYLKIKDFVTGLFGQPHQRRYYLLLDYLTGAKSFRDKQLEAIKVVTERNSNLVFVSPTGSGKSLIYQIAGILSQDQTLVMSPLMALQKDQVESLWKRWVPATLINSSILPQEKEKRISNILNKSYSFVFAHPRQFLDKDANGQIKLKAKNVLTQAHFGTFCVDEAHVISNWGKQFIEEYAELLQLRTHFNVPRTILLSASLTKNMQDNIVETLFNEDDKPEVIVTGFYRPEIKLFVKTFGPLNEAREGRLMFLNRLLNENRNNKTIVFCTITRHVDEVTQFLKSKGHNAEGFYGKLDSKLKTQIQNRFSGQYGKEIDILVCTSAFGMGINIPNIHLAVHYSLPFSLNDYYQQFGRIGRDGKYSKAYLLYDTSEGTQLINYIQGKQLEDVKDPFKKQLILNSFAKDTKDLMDYIESGDKWGFILNYFGESKTESLFKKSRKRFTIVLIIMVIILLVIFIAMNFVK
jgi:ATP-dependent DNA helicase RecQ